MKISEARLEGGRSYMSGSPGKAMMKHGCLKCSLEGEMQFCCPSANKSLITGTPAWVQWATSRAEHI